MITKKQWQKFCQDVDRMSWSYDVWIKGSLVTSVEVDESDMYIVCENRVVKTKTKFTHAGSCRDLSTGKPHSLNYIYYITKVKTKPSKIINTTLGLAIQQVKI